jgi:hypothetical protein
MRSDEKGRVAPQENALGKAFGRVQSENVVQYGNNPFQDWYVLVASHNLTYPITHLIE